MAKDKKNASASNKEPHAYGRVGGFLHDERTQFVSGLLILVVGSFLGLAFISFLFTGKADQAQLEHLPVTELTSVKNTINNWTGSLGAYLSEVLINRWMGVSAFLFIYLLLRWGYALLNNTTRHRGLGQLALRCALWCIWGSLFLGFFFVDGYDDTYLYLGGHHGYTLSLLLRANIGWVGTLLVIVASFILLSMTVCKTTIQKTRRILGVWPRLQRLRAAKEAERMAMEESAATQATSETTSQEVSDAVTSSNTTQPGFAASEQQPAPVQEPQDVETSPLYPAPSEEFYTPDEDPSLDTTPDDSTVGTPEFVEEELPVDTSSLPTELQPTDDPQFSIQTHKDDLLDQPVMQQEEYDPTAELSHYKFPTFDLLKQYNTDIPVDLEEQNANKELIRKTLHDYGIEIQSINAIVGPTITLFEIVPVEGTRIARIRGLQDEIAMSIAAATGIRIIAPIPGKTAIGIEVPNRDPQVVSMHSVITSRTFQESHYELPVALGKTITNEVFTFDLAKMPHLLVAGATGQGKSVGLNAILTSLLYKKHPSQLKMVLIDPKQVEFSIYSRIEKHFLAKLPTEEEPIITDVTKVVATLNSVVIEMEDRYALLKDAGQRNIKEYNERFIHRELNPTRPVSSPGGSSGVIYHHFMPYIVVVVDEYGDLIMTAGKEIELPIARIAQKARAVGIHMIIATQRPSARIITGIIKANFPARMAFRVGQSIDSSIILDKPGAQQLIGRGDLLFSSGNNLTRVQCAFVDTPEVDRINRYIAEQQSYPTAFILPEPPSDGNGDGESGGPVDLNHLDPLFNEAAEMVVASGQGSTSMIQRKFSIGYNRAGRLMDQLEAAGIVGPYEGSKARSVLVGDDIELRQVLDNLHKG
jgi:S-DNA-T family DNA segregation ATPase FtsK/SpoIIIE